MIEPNTKDDHATIKNKAGLYPIFQVYTLHEKISTMNIICEN